MNSGSEAYERILKAIVTSELKPGDTVAEIQLAERFGFGRTPVREAIMRLENEGFIVSSERKKRVYILFAQDIENIFSIKQAIECMVSRKATVFAEEDDKRELASVIEEMKKIDTGKGSLDDASIQNWLALDARFHSVLFKMARNHRAENIVDNLNLQFRRIKVGTMVLEGRIEKAIQEHSAIGYAILSGDGEEASRLMFEHMENVKCMIIKLMDAFYYVS